MDEILRTAATLYPGPSFGDRLQRLRPRICPFEALLPFVPERSRVLDVGCGAGLFLGLLASHGRLARGVGVDPSREALARAELMRERLPRPMRDALTFSAGSVEDLGEKTFDVVSMVDVMHHIGPARQREAFLQVASRVAPGGVLLYKDLSPFPRWRAMANRAHDLALSHQWVHYVTARALDDWVAASGLALASSLELPRLWYAHHAIVLRRAPEHGMTS